MISVAIVILNWNGQKYLEEYLGILIQRTQLEGSKIFVADNGSTDNSIEWMETNYPEINLIKFDKNYGFTGGYNKALKLIDAKYYVLLNSDVEVGEKWLNPLFEYLEANTNCAACVPKVKSSANPDFFEYAGACGGYIDKYGYPFCRGRILSDLEKDNGQYDKIEEVFWASGVSLMIRSEIYHKLGGLDEVFFAHMEEIDLCWRIKHLGYSIVTIPSSTIYHVGGGSLPNNSPQKLYLNYRNNLLMLYKNLPSKNRHYYLFIRKILDGISAIMYLLQGKPKFFNSVIKAHFDYYRLKKAVTKTISTPVYNKTGIFPTSIVLKFFLSGQKLKFDQIKDSF